MAVDQARREHHERVIGADRCDRVGNLLRGDQGAGADDHTGKALVGHSGLQINMFLACLSHFPWIRCLALSIVVGLSLRQSNP